MTQELASLLTRYAQAGSLRELVACVRDFAAHDAPRLSGGRKIRLALTGNYSTQFIARGFPLAMAARHIGMDLYESPYNHWRIDLLDAGSALYRSAPTHIVLALTSIELAYGTLRSTQAVISAIVAAVEAALQASDAHVLVTLPEPLEIGRAHV